MNAEIPIEQFEIFVSGLDHPECCAFDRAGNLWAGGEAGQIYRISPSGRVETVANLGSFCAGLAFSPNDELFVCVPGKGIIRVASGGAYKVFATHAADHQIVTANYLAFDRLGRIYATDSGNWMQRNGFLLRFDAAGQGEVVAGPFGYANGLALSADERELFMVESDTDSVLRFDLAAATHGRAADAKAELMWPEVYADHVGRFPDGLVLDEHGNLYVCCYASDEIWRIRTDRRKTLLAHDRWGIRLGRPTNMAFGGPNFEEMYVANLGRYTITRAKLGLRGQPLANLRGLA